MLSTVLEARHGGRARAGTQQRLPPSRPHMLPCRLCLPLPQVVESGVDFLVVRAAPSDRVTDRYGEQANVVVAPAGRLPNNLQVSRAQVRCRG